MGDISGGNASIYVRDMDRAIAFYQDKLGLTLKVRIKNEWAEFDAGKGLVLGLHPEHPPQSKAGTPPGSINIELAVTKPLETVVATLKERRVRFKKLVKDGTEYEIEKYENVHLAWFFDDDGNELVLAQVINAQ